MSQLRDFVAGLMEHRGAVVEAMEADRLEVLAPEPLRQAMGWPELARLGFGARAPSRRDPDRARGRLARPLRRAARRATGAGPSAAALPAAALAAPGTRNACSSARSICPTRSGASRRRPRPSPAACCWPSATPRSPTRSAKGSSGSGSTSAPAPSSTKSWRGCARLCAGSPTGRLPEPAVRRGRAGVGGRSARGAGPPAARPRVRAGHRAVPARHAPPARARPRPRPRLSR